MRPTLNRRKLQDLVKHAEVHSVSGIATIMSTELQCALLKLRANGCSGVGIGTFAFCAEPTGTVNLLTRSTTQPGAHSL
jgi:hypothetical protein